ncbi:MAG: hypothetical protein K6E30_10080 [Lachnospiraceae bacterium]|nr:hypothetical protein [Lachnospiraceae bacterium]
MLSSIEICAAQADRLLACPPAPDLSMSLSRSGQSENIKFNPDCLVGRFKGHWSLQEGCGTEWMCASLYNQQGDMLLESS